MTRLIAIAVAVAALALVALVLGGKPAEPSTRDVLTREAATLLPAGVRVDDVSYRKPCSVLLDRPMPPCLSLRLELSGSVEERARAVIAQAGRAWALTEDLVGDGRIIRLRRGDVRAHITLRGPRDRARCRAVLDPSSCDDRLHVEVGKRPALPRIDVAVAPASLLDGLTPEELRAVSDREILVRPGERP